MAMETIKELKNKPLVEALFEMRWGLNGPPGIAVDPNYQLLIGQLYSQIRERFPQHVRLATAEIPEQMVPFTPQHQFRPGPGNWPLVQLGPGLLTVNDTEAYLWDNFKELCRYASDALFEVYPRADNALRITEVSLRYIDADFLEGEAVLEFLKKLKINVKLPTSLFGDSRVDDSTLAVGLTLEFPTSEPRGTIRLAFNQGRKSDKEALIWDTRVTSRGGDAPTEPLRIAEWLEKAHLITHDWFMRLIEGELLEKYR
jgi:uncharacterized protein (TIGR04255 family)